MISLNGKILYNDSLISNLFGSSMTIINLNSPKIPNKISFPLGYSNLAQDLEIIYLKKQSVIRFGAVFSNKYFGIFTFERNPLMYDNNVCGIINKFDFGKDQLKNNLCFNSLIKLKYGQDIITKAEIKVLSLLSQFPLIKAEDIKNIIGNINLKSAYMYKYELNNKFRHISSDIKIRKYIDMLYNLFKVSPKDDQYIVLMQDEWLSHIENLSLDRAKFLRFENKFDENILNKWHRFQIQQQFSLS
ncbi:hypothetical protein L3V83_15400 [Thiotrichales bacterium 19X7-9]|nr:hypothetical protein [Thiotrichales bacterium 19X7-9]